MLSVALTKYFFDNFFIFLYMIRASFVSPKIFSENFVAIRKIKPVLMLDKPIYVGFSILNSSKLLLYELH